MSIAPHHPPFPFPAPSPARHWPEQLPPFCKGNSAGETALATVVLTSPGLEAEASLIPRFCNWRAVLPLEIIPALEAAAPALSTGSRPPMLLSGARNEREKPLSRLVPRRAAWLGTTHHKKGQQKRFEIWRLDAAAVPIDSRAAAKGRAGLTPELLPVTQRGARAGQEQPAASSWLTLPHPSGSLGMAVHFLPVPRYTKYRCMPQSGGEGHSGQSRCIRQLSQSSQQGTPQSTPS